MPTARVLDSLQLLVRPPDDRPDGECLRRFLASRDEAAFAELVRRHGPTVYGVCRRILGPGPEADDAFQATFFVLARKAASIRNGAAVAAWLYAVAVKVAHKARTQAVKRRVRQMAAAKPEAVLPPTPEADLWAVLDEELAKLPADLRQAVLACDVGGRSRSQAAKDLGWAEGTVAKRLAKAREQLARRLTRRGISLSVAALAAALGERATAAVPGVLLAETARQATAFAGGTAGSLAVQTLAEGVMRSLKLGVFKAWLLVGLLGLTLTGGGLMLAGGPGDEPSTGEPKVLITAPVPKAVAATVWKEKTVLELTGMLPVSVAYSANGKTMVVGGAEGQVEAFDTATQKKRWEAEYGGSHASVAYAADGKQVYATTKDGVRLLDAATGKLEDTLKGIEPDPIAVGVFPDVQVIGGEVPGHYTRSQVLVGTTRGYAVQSWVAGKLPGTLGTIQTTTTPKGEQPADEYAVPLAVDPMGRCAIMAGPRDPQTNKNVLWAYVCGDHGKDSPGNRLMAGHAAAVVSAAWSKDGTTAVTGDADGRVIVWDGKTMKETRRLELGGRVAALAITADAKHVAAVVTGKQADFCVWEVAKKDAPKSLHAEAHGFTGEAVVASLAFSTDGTQLAGCVCNKAELSYLGILRGKVRVWEVAGAPKAERSPWKEGKPFADLPSWPVANFSVSPDGKLLAVVAGNSISIHDPATQARLDKGRVGQLKAPATRVAVAFSPTGKLAVTAQNGVVAFEDVLAEVPRFATRDDLWEASHDFDPHQLVWLEDAEAGQSILATDGRRTREAGWKLFEGKPARVKDQSWSDLTPEDFHKPALLATVPGRMAFFSGDEARRATAEPVVSARVFDTNPKTHRRLSGHTARPVCGAVSPDGSRFLSADADGGLMAWAHGAGKLDSFKVQQRWKLGDTIAGVAVAADNKTAAVLRVREQKAGGTPTTEWQLYLFDLTAPPADPKPVWTTSLPGSYSEPELPITKPDGTVEGPAFASLAFHPDGTKLYASLAEPYVRGPKATDPGWQKPIGLRVWEKPPARP